MADITIDYCLKTIKNAPDKEKVENYVEIVQQEINNYMSASAATLYPNASSMLIKEARRLDILLDEALAYLPEMAEAT
jgi:hypothetical protein